MNGSVWKVMKTYCRVMRERLGRRPPCSMTVARRPAGECRTRVRQRRAMPAVPGNPVKRQRHAHVCFSSWLRVLD